MLFDVRMIFLFNSYFDNSSKVFDNAILETQKPLKKEISGNFNLDLINLKKNSKKPNILKTPNRKSIELTETKIMEELNICIRQKVMINSNNEKNVNQSSLSKVFLNILKRNFQKTLTKS